MLIISIMLIITIISIIQIIPNCSTDKIDNKTPRILSITCPEFADHCES